MAQPYPPYPPARPFSPAQRTDSSHGGSRPLDTKQPAHSPTSQSPYNSPAQAPSNIALPNQVFSSPYYGAQANGTPSTGAYANASNGHYNNARSPYSSHANSPYQTQATGAYTSHSAPSYPSTPASSFPPYPAHHAGQNHQSSHTSPVSRQNAPPGGMAPPSRPQSDNKPTDINELGDVLAGSGIDLREEEAAMLRGSNDQHSRDNTHRTPIPYPFPRDNYYSANVVGDRQSFYGSGMYNQPAGMYRSAEAIAKQEEARLRRRKHEVGQYHLNDPFLESGRVHRIFALEQNRNHIKFDDSHVFFPGQQPQPQQRYLQDSSGNTLLRTSHNEKVIQLGPTRAEILTLISLASEERMRSFVEDAAVLARQRRIGSLGFPPPDLINPAVESDTTNVVDGLATSSNEGGSSVSNPLKRSYAEVNASPTKSPWPSSTPLLNVVAKALRDIDQHERALEETRLAKRRQRASVKSKDANSLEAGTPSIGEIAPEVESRKPGPKKASTKVMDEAQQRQQVMASNKTMQMALGGKSLSWMKKGPSTPSNPYLQKPVSKSENPASVGSNEPPSAIPKSRAHGEFREDKDDGKGIQMRDLLFVLEEDGKATKALQLAYPRLRQSDR